MLRYTQHDCIVDTYMKLPISLPNILTSVRIALIPVLVAVFYIQFESHYLVAAGIFTLASVTDWLDGYLARRLNEMTPFGAFLDPVAAAAREVSPCSTL